MQFFFGFGSSTNISDYNLEPTIHLTELFYNRHYNLYYANIATFFVLGILPMSLLIYYNLNIYVRIKSSNVVIGQDNSKSARFKQEKNLSLVMIGIVAVFMICHSLRNILSFYLMIQLNTVQGCHDVGHLIALPVWCYILYSVNYLLLAINSSINMIVYCCLNSKFRKHLCAIVAPISRSIRARTVSFPLSQPDNKDCSENEEQNIGPQI